MDQGKRDELRALCVGRHRYLSEHLGSYFRRIGLDCVCVVGISEAVDAARRHRPHVVIGDYDLLATQPLRELEADRVLSRIPLLAVSLSRRGDEAPPMDVNEIAGYLYLPTLDGLDARRLLRAIDPASSYSLPSARDRARLDLPTPG